MSVRFESVREDRPGARWLALLERTWPAYERWFLHGGEHARPGFVSCRAALRRYMPELVELWQRLVALGGGGDHLARMLSLWRPAAYLSGCSQAAWTRGAPLLVRNYDYHPDLIEGRVLMSRWLDTPVIAQSDCLWGVLDGMNAHGLAVSLSFGGNQAQGDGFGIPIILRYVLETCRGVDDARDALCRVPSHMAYNVTVLDAEGRACTVELAPDRPPRALADGLATNHQAGPGWARHAELTRSHERAALLRERLADPREQPDELVARFMRPPLYNVAYARAHGTLYGAVYQPRAGAVDYLWPDARWRLAFDDFAERSLDVRYRDGTPATSAGP